MLEQNLPLNKYINAETRSEWCFAILTCLLWGHDLFEYVYVAFDLVLHMGNFIRTTGRDILYIVLALGAKDYFKDKVRYIDFLFIIVALFVYFFSPELERGIYEEHRDFTTLFLHALPLYIIGISIDFQKLKRPLWYISILTILVCVFYNLVHIRSSNYTGSAEVTNESMSASYSILYPTIYMLWCTMKDFKIVGLEALINLTVSTLGVFAILVLGTRGPVVCLILFILSYIFFYKVTRRKILYGTVLIFTIALVYYNFDTIMIYLQGVSQSLGFSTRVFDYFLSDRNLASEDRSDFYPVLIKAMNESPIWGYGIFGSYKFIHQYPHNIFTEIIVSFGYVIGGGMIYIMAHNAIKGFRNKLSENENNFLFVMIFEGIVCLLFSNTFVAAPFFFMFLGYSIQMAYRKEQIFELNNNDASD